MALQAPFYIDLSKLVPGAWAVAHVGIEGQILVVELMGVNCNGVYIGISRYKAKCPSVDSER